MLFFCLVLHKQVLSGFKISKSCFKICEPT